MVSAFLFFFNTGSMRGLSMMRMMQDLEITSLDHSTIQEETITIGYLKALRN